MKLLQCNFMTWVLIVISSIIFLDQLDKRNSSLTKLAVIGTKVIKKKTSDQSFFVVLFNTIFKVYTLFTVIAKYWLHPPCCTIHA